MDDTRSEYARSVAERIEAEFTKRLRRFMAMAVPLQEIQRVQAEHDARAREAATEVRVLRAREHGPARRPEPRPVRSAA
jgi:hypothetical protein